MTDGERIEILRVMLKNCEMQIKKYEIDKQRYLQELCGKIDALVEILMELGMSEREARPLRDTILAKGTIIHKIKQLKARVPKPKHSDKRKPGELQHPLPGQKELGFNG